MLTEAQRNFWHEYIKIIGENAFLIQQDSEGNSIVHSKFYCGIDPSDALGGQGMVQVAINRAKEYQKLFSKRVVTINDLKTALTSFVQSQFYHTELAHYLPLLQNAISNKQHWDLIIQCWCLQEFTTAGDKADAWRKVFQLRKPNKSFTEMLPSKFVAYRAGGLDGFSWTLDKEVAQWFHQRFADQFGAIPFTERSFLSEDVLFYNNNRNEKEVVILPS
jgi:hypothetical protein